VVDGLAEEVGLRHEVGVEDRQELAAGLRDAGGERAGLVAATVRAVEVDDVVAPGAELSAILRAAISRLSSVESSRSWISSRSRGHSMAQTVSSSRSTTNCSLNTGSWIVTNGSDGNRPAGTGSLPRRR
jgi:hypothetical protein